MKKIHDLIQIHGIKAIVLREFIVFLREKERIISSVISPLLFLFIIGRGLNQDKLIDGYTYQQFILPGIIAMNILFTSIRYGLYVIWDKRMDFLKEVLVAPISRTSLFTGKALGGIITAMIEMLVIIAVSYFTVLKINFIQLIFIILFSFVSSFMLVSIGLSIGGLMKTMEGFGLVMSIVTWPMFLLSGALFELNKSTSLIQKLAMLNPLTYCVDLLRYIMLGIKNIGIWIDISVIFLWTALLFITGVKIFENIDNQK